MAAGVRFRVTGIPVEVQASFALIALFGLASGSLAVGAAWTGIVFVTTLVHELGHAFAFRAFGLRPRIVLYWFGGYTTAAGELSRGRRIATLLSGSFLELALLGVPALYLRSQVVPATPEGRRILDTLVFVGVGWAVLNLLPVLPLDGGQVAQALLTRSDPERGTRLARMLSIAVAVGVAIFAAVERVFFGAIYAAWFAGDNATKLQEARESPLVEHVREGHRMLERGDLAGAAALGSEILRKARTAATRALAADLAAWSDAARGPSAHAGRAADQPENTQRTSRYVQAYEASLAQQPEAAVERTLAGLETEAVAPPNFLLARELERAGLLDRVVDLLMAQPGARGAHAVDALSTDLHRSGSHATAGRLDVRLFDDGRIDRGRAAFNAACSLARDGATQPALEWLGRAVEHGFRDLEQLDGDEDLGSVRGLPAFSDIRRRMAERAAG